MVHVHTLTVGSRGPRVVWDSGGRLCSSLGRHCNSVAEKSGCRALWRSGILTGRTGVLADWGNVALEEKRNNGSK